MIATEVIMPALGMAQETGKLLNWMKAPGDAVQTGDVLFEVETDKSVSEVEAQADGFLADVTANPGDDVPVGQRVAMISDTAEDSAPARFPQCQAIGGGRGAGPHPIAAGGASAALPCLGSGRFV